MVGVTPAVAIVGTGMMGEIHRRSAILAGARLVGVMGSSQEKSIAIAEAWNAERSFSSIEEIASSADVDFVHLCSPNGLHFSQLKTLLTHGKNVICEKPIVTSLRDALELEEITRATNTKVAIPFVYRFHPMVRELRARVKAGDLGKIDIIHGSYLQDWLVGEEATNWRVDSVLGGQSRAFADIGSHWCDLVEWLLDDELVELLAHPVRTNKTRPGFSSNESVVVGNEDALALVATTKSGATVNAIFSQVSQGRKNRLWLEVDGRAKSAVFDQELPEFLEIGGPSGFSVIARNPKTNSEDANRYSMVPAGHAQGYLECFESFVREAYQYLSGQEVDGMPTFADGLKSSKLIDAVLRSAHSRSWVMV